MRRVSREKIVRDVIFCVKHFITLCETCTFYRQYTGQPKREAYIHFYCMELLGVIFTIMLTSPYNVKKI